MPISSSHKTYSVISEGTQYIENTLTLPSSPDTATLYLDPSIYTQAGYYIIFDYTESAAPTPVSGSIAQLIVSPPAGLSVDTSISSNGLYDTGKTIVLRLI